MTDIRYARQEHVWGPLALRYTNSEAWVFSPAIKHWVQMHLAWQFAKCVVPAGRALVLTREEFERTFPDLPPLPEGAFETPLTGPSYGHWEHVPMRFSDRGAWICPLSNKLWKPLDEAEVEKGRSMTRREFERLFPDLPPLPDEAFQPI